MPKNRRKDKPAGARKRIKKPREGPASLYPLSFEEAVRGLLQAKIEKEERPPAKNRRGAPKGQT